MEENKYFKRNDKGRAVFVEGFDRMWDYPRMVPQGGECWIVEADGSRTPYDNMRFYVIMDGVDPGDDLAHAIHTYLADQPGWARRPTFDEMFTGRVFVREGVRHGNPAGGERCLCRKHNGKDTVHIPIIRQF